MADKKQFKPLPKTAFNEYKLRLFGPMQPNAEREPTFSVNVIKNNPRFDVFTNIPGDKDNGRISAPMDGITAMSVLMGMEDIIDGEPDTQLQVTNKTGRPENKTILSTTVIGKDKDGRIYISLTAQGRPKIKFTFLPSDYHLFAGKGGEVMPEGKLSCIYATGWVNLMKGLMVNVMDTYYTAPEPRGDYKPNNNNKQDAGGKPKEKAYDANGYGNKNSWSKEGYDKKDYNSKATTKPDAYPM